MRFLPAAITPVGTGDVLSAISMQHQGLQDFETRLARYFEKSHAYTFGSLMRTTYACFVALAKTDTRTKVILPRYSCPSFAHGVKAAGLEIVYCDVDPETLAISLESLKKTDLQGVLAIVCANLFGLTSDVVAILDVCKPLGIHVIEGVDYGIGTQFQGRRIGTWGEIAILNFQEGKALPVGGGAVVSDLPAFANMYGGTRQSAFPNVAMLLGFSVFSKPLMYGVLMRGLSMLGVNRKKLSMEDTIRKTQAESDFVFDERGFDHAVSNMQGRLGCMLLDRLDHDANAREKNAGLLAAGMAKIAGVTSIRPLAAASNVHFIRFPILVHNGRRDAVLAALLKAGIEASPMYIEHGLHVKQEEFPGAAQVAHELLTLPCHPYVSASDIERTVAIISRTAC